MLQFWCLSPVRVAYHGSFRENLESAFWGLGLSYHNLIKHMQVFKTQHLKCCSFDASPQSEWLITAHLERIWSQHFGALGCHITSWLSTSKSPKRSSWNVAVLMPLPVRVVYHGSFRQNLESAFCDFGVSYRSLIRQMQLFKKGTSEMLQFWCLSPVRVAYHGSFRENLESAFWSLGLSYHNLIKHMQVFKTQHLKCCSFDASPQSEWLITAHLERIWSQHFGALGCHITSWLSTSKSPKRSSWNVAVLMPLPVKVAYHGSFRENLGSAFCDFGVSYRSLIRQMQVFKRAPLKCCNFDAPPQSELLITAHLERIWTHDFGALECHIKFD